MSEEKSPLSPERKRVVEDTAKLLNRLQALLRLRDWEIETQFWEYAELAVHRNGDTYGCIVFYPCTKTAQMSLLWPDEYHRMKTAGTPKTAEFEFQNTVIHEMVHLAMHPMDNGKKTRVGEEEAVDTIAGALQKLICEIDEIKETPCPKRKATTK